VVPTAVIAHTGGHLTGGLDGLRELLEEEGVTEPLWYECSDLRRVPERARRALEHGADPIFVWGGDGTVQQCVNALAGKGATLAILPAGTGNLLAANLGVPEDLPRAVDIGLYGSRRSIDTGSVNGEHFALMAGAGLDAQTMQDTGTEIKAFLGPTAYLLAGAKNIATPPVPVEIVVDGRRFYSDDVALVVAANFAKTMADIEAFAEATPDDGVLELGIVTAASITEWVRTLASLALGDVERSPFTQFTRGHRFEIRFSRPTIYELDGNPRKPVRRLRVRVHPSSITFCVPPDDDT
jgi:YegS/Rv2252/BmrU family lipid kinase